MDADGHFDDAAAGGEVVASGRNMRVVGERVEARGELRQYREQCLDGWFGGRKCVEELW